MYNILIISETEKTSTVYDNKRFEFIRESEFDTISSDSCDAVVMYEDTAMRFLKRNIPVCKSGIETVIVVSQENKDLKNAAGGAYFIDAPCGKEEMAERIDDCMCSAKMRRAKENFERMVLEEAERVKPIIREQFLRDYILGVGDTNEIFNIYCKTFGVEYSMKTRMLIMKTEPVPDFDERFFVSNLAEGYIGKQNILLSTSIKEGTLFVIRMIEDAKLAESLTKISKALARYYNYTATIVYSAKHNLGDAPQVYEHLRQCISYCFYSKNESIFYAGDIATDNAQLKLDPDYCAIERSLKNSDVKKSTALLDNFFDEIERVKIDPPLAKTYCLELYVCIIRCCEAEQIDKYMKGIVEFQSLKKLDDIRAYIMNIAAEIIEANQPQFKKTYSVLISDTLQIIESNIGNENLSLRWLAGSILYTNVDYLGKLFKKEVGENFSHYVMKKRMEMAKKLILGGEKDKIYEVAEKVGYGSNSQYFSQVFKKYTGASPLEYKEFSKQKKHA